MSRKRHSIQKFVNLLGEAKNLLAQGQMVGRSIDELGIGPELRLLESRVRRSQGRPDQAHMVLEQENAQLKRAVGDLCPWMS